MAYAIGRQNNIFFKKESFSILVNSSAAGRNTKNKKFSLQPMQIITPMTRRAHAEVFQRVRKPNSTPMQNKHNPKVAYVSAGPRRVYTSIQYG
jgi:hypothetical protein